MSSTDAAAKAATANNGWAGNPLLVVPFAKVAGVGPPEDANGGSYTHPHMDRQGPPIPAATKKPSLFPVGPSGDQGAGTGPGKPSEPSPSFSRTVPTYGTSVPSQGPSPLGSFGSFQANPSMSSFGSFRGPEGTVPASSNAPRMPPHVAPGRLGNYLFFFPFFVGFCWGRGAAFPSSAFKSLQ